MIEVSNHTSYPASEIASLFSARHLGAGRAGLFQAEITQQCEGRHSPEGQSNRKHSASFHLLDLDPLGLCRRASHSASSLTADAEWEV